MTVETLPNAPGAPMFPQGPRGPVQLSTGLAHHEDQLHGARVPCTPKPSPSEGGGGFGVTAPGGNASECPSDARQGPRAHRDLLRRAPGRTCSAANSRSTLSARARSAASCSGRLGARCTARVLSVKACAAPHPSPSPVTAPPCGSGSAVP